MKIYFRINNSTIRLCTSFAAACLLLVGFKLAAPMMCNQIIGLSDKHKLSVQDAQRPALSCNGSVVLLTRRSKHPLYDSVVGLGATTDLLSRILITTQAVKIDPALDASLYAKGAPSGLSLVRDGFVYQIASPRLRAFFYMVGLLDTVVIPQGLASLPFVNWGTQRSFQLVVSPEELNPTIPVPANVLFMSSSELAKYSMLNFSDSMDLLRCQ